jgi:hypothetical protein
MRMNRQFDPNPQFFQKQPMIGAIRQNANFTRVEPPGKPVLQEVTRLHRGQTSLSQKSTLIAP